MKILFVDDNPADFELAKIALKGMPDLEFVYVEDFENFKKQYSPDKYAAIISDYNLSGELGTDIFQLVKKAEPEIPFIIISGALGEARAVEILKLGITDYVLKDNIEKLPLALLRALKEAEIKKAENLAQQKLKLSEEKYRSVVEDQTEYIVRWKPNGEIIFANKSFLDFTQIKEEDIHDKNYYALVPEKEEIRFKNKINSLSRDNTVVTDIHQAHHPIHDDYWQEWTDRAFFDVKGKVVEFQSVGRDITNQKLAEIEVEKSEEKYRLLVENMSEGLMYVDLECTILYTNQRFSEMTGYSKAELIGKKAAEILLNTEGRKFLNNINEKRKLGESSRYEIEIITKSGKKIWANINGAPLRNLDGEIIGSIGNHTDITLQKQIQGALIESEEKFRKIFETIEDVYYQTDLNGICTMISPSVYELLGYETTEVIGKEIKMFYENLDLQEDFVSEITEAGRGNNLETTLISKNGQRVYVSANINLRYDNLGNAIGLQGLLHNITEKKKQEFSLRVSEKRYRGLFESMTDGLLFSDPEGYLMMVNPSFCKMLGYNEEELLGKNGYALFHAQEKGKEIKEKIKERKQGISENYELEFICKSGKKRWMQVSASPSLSEDGEFVGVMSILTDITETKQRELQLKTTINELNDRNNEAMQFNYIVSHNLRSPIASIIGLSHLINSPDTSEEEMPLIIKHITDSTLKMDELVKDLNVILSSRSTINTQKDKVNISELLNSIKDTLSNPIKISDCELNIKVAKDANELFISKSYLESIIYNLLSNAIKFRGEDRRAVVTVSVENINDCFQITVSDNGIGIDLAQHGSTIFGLYKRFNLDVEGKGLGLHMTKTQVEALGGTISIQSEIGKGSTFIVSFKN